VDGLNALTAAPWRETIDGVDYWMEPLTLGDWGIIEEHLARQRRNPLEVAKENLAGLAADEKRALLASALEQASGAGRVTADELMDYTATPEGLGLMFWLSIRKQNPQISEGWAAELLGILDAESAARLRAEIEGASGTAEDPAKK